MLRLHPTLRFWPLCLALLVALGGPLPLRAEDESVEELEAEINAMGEAEAKGTEQTVAAEEAAPSASEADSGADTAIANEDLDQQVSSTEQEVGAADGEFREDADDRPPPVPERTYTSEEFRNMSRQEILNYHRDKIHKLAGLQDESTIAAVQPATRKYCLNVGGMALADSDGQSVWPTFQYHSAVNKHYTWGVIGSLAEFQLSRLEVRSYTAMAALTYYPQDTYDGAFARLGLGFARYYYRVSGNQEYQTETVSFNGMATLGWRFSADEGTFNFGVEGGVIYYYLPSAPGDAFSRAGSITASVVYPVAFIDIGFAF